MMQTEGNRINVNRERGRVSLHTETTKSIQPPKNDP